MVNVCSWRENRHTAGVSLVDRKSPTWVDRSLKMRVRAPATTAHQLAVMNDRWTATICAFNRQMAATQPTLKEKVDQAQLATAQLDQGCTATNLDCLFYLTKFVSLLLYIGDVPAVVHNGKARDSVDFPQKQ